jgi:cysteinyl-tRNA synthetase
VNRHEDHKETISKSKLQYWYKPNNEIHTGIKIFNSLRHEKNEFIPKDTKRRSMNWYTCGPTVYEMSQMGYAR